jgi:hypothetical protein
MHIDGFDMSDICLAEAATRVVFVTKKSRAQMRQAAAAMHLHMQRECHPACRMVTLQQTWAENQINLHLNSAERINKLGL